MSHRIFTLLLGYVVLWSAGCSGPDQTNKQHEDGTIDTSKQQDVIDVITADITDSEDIQMDADGKAADGDPAGQSYDQETGP